VTHTRTDAEVAQRISRLEWQLADERRKRIAAERIARQWRSYALRLKAAADAKEAPALSSA